MKHIETYRTCDRCGSKLENDIKKESFSIIRKIVRKWLPIETQTNENYAYIKDEVLRDAGKEFEILEMEVIVGYDIKRRNYDLCADCRKAFERFMRNEHNSTTV